MLEAPGGLDSPAFETLLQLLEVLVNTGLPNEYVEHVVGVVQEKVWRGVPRNPLPTPTMVPTRRRAICQDTLDGRPFGLQRKSSADDSAAWSKVRTHLMVKSGVPFFICQAHPTSSISERIRRGGSGLAILVAWLVGPKIFQYKLPKIF